MSDHKPAKPYEEQARQQKRQEKRQERHPHEDRLDAELDDSFPASDPPSMTQPHARHGRPQRTQSKDAETKAHGRK